jgi:uncharacterized protein YndB with AHSA1/START domain
MINVEQSIVIDRPAHEVFAFVADQTNAPRWQRGIRELRRTTHGPIGAGTRHRFVRTLMGRPLEGTNEYTRYEPDNLVVFTATSGGWPLEASYAVVPVADGRARLIARIELHPTGPFRLLEPLLAATLRRDVRTNLPSLKTLLETGHPMPESTA